MHGKRLRDRRDGVQANNSDVRPATRGSAEYSAASNTALEAVEKAVSAVSERVEQNTVVLIRQANRRG